MNSDEFASSSPIRTTPTYGQTTFLPTSSPIRMNRKRGSNDEDDEEYDSCEYSRKKIQQLRIHSEAHIRTVSMMMSLKQQQALSDGEEVTMEEPIKSSYHQKPYW